MAGSHPLHGVVGPQCLGMTDSGSTFQLEPLQVRANSRCSTGESVVTKYLVPSLSRLFKLTIGAGVTVRTVLVSDSKEASCPAIVDGGVVGDVCSEQPANTIASSAVDNSDVEFFIKRGDAQRMNSAAAGH